MERFEFVGTGTGAGNNNNNNNDNGRAFKLDSNITWDNIRELIISQPK